MRLSKAQTTSRVHALPTLRFETQRLTAFSGLVLLQVLLRRLRLKERLNQCLGPDAGRGSYGRNRSGPLLSRGAGHANRQA